jgi:diaminopimelate decarboxylase
VNHFHYRDGVLHCEDVSLETVAADVGTPVYIYSTATLERHYRVFSDAFAPMAPLVAYAVKANSNIAVIATLAKLGAGADTVSAGEIARALRAGVPPARIVFSGVGKRREELAYAVDVGVHQINVESAAELALLEEVVSAAGKRAAIAIRVNPDVGAGGHDKISTGKSGAKFGVSIDTARALHARAHAHPLLEATGFAVHIGSQIRDLAPLESAFRVLRQLAEDVRAQGLPVTRLDLGGGLGVPYFNEPDPPSPDAYAAMVKRVFDGFDAALSFEPGRMIAGNAGILLSRVVRVQPRPERDILVLDAAMNDLIRPAMYDAFHDIWPVRESDGPRAPVDVVGPVCETGDTFTRARPLPPLASGDLVAFMTAGAYGAAMASTYNTRPLVPEVLVRGARFDVVRRRWSVEEQLELEHIPE